MATAVSVVAPALAAEWMTDWEAAKTRAAAEGKALLVNFTGSDWCAPCANMHKVVLDTPGFEAYTKDKFVLMEVDMPRKHPQPEALGKQNRTLCHDYRVEGFPTVMVMTPQGRLIGGFGGAHLDLCTVKLILDTALENGRNLEKAATLPDEERARILYSVYCNLPESFRVTSGIGEELLEADPDNKTGFRAEQEERGQWAEFSRKVEGAGTDSAKLRAVVTEAIESALPANKAKMEQMLAQLDFSEIYRQVDAMSATPKKAVALLEEKAKVVPASILGDVLTLKAEMQILAAECVEDILAAKVSMEQAFAVAPPSPSFRAYFEKRFADPASFLSEVKKQRHQN